MDFILYKLGDSFVVDFNNIEKQPHEMLDIMGGMEVLLKSYFDRAAVTPEEMLDNTERTLGLIREHIGQLVEDKIISQKGDKVIDQMNREIAAGKPISEAEGDRRTTAAELEAKSLVDIFKSGFPGNGKYC